MDPIVLKVEGLVKDYGDIRAVAGISFEVEGGSVFTLLGPNGAGKTTTLEILEGIRSPDAGTMTLFGRRLRRVDRAAKQRIGVLLQEGNFEPYLKVKEVVRLFASFFVHARPVEEILQSVGLEEKRDALVRGLSGGQKQRLAVGVALINDPELVLLDEPTTGLDPQARRNIWSIVDRLKGGGKTVILTTHYMEEAEVLADSVCIMDHGSIIAEGSPRELAERFGEETVIEFSAGGAPADALERLRGLSDEAQLDGETVILETSDLTGTMEGLLAWARENRTPLRQLIVRQPNLEDVFLALTGRRLRE